MSRAVVLLKSPPRDSSTDAYVQQLTSSGYIPYFIEALESVFSNENSLEDVVRTGPNGFFGVAITSSRAADAWIRALRNVAEPGDWFETPFFVVGEATARTLKQIVTSHPTKFSHSLILGAAEAGKSESLAQFILADLSSKGGTSGKLLYLTGDKNKDTFHQIMMENDVNVERLRVYETMAASDLGEKVALTAHEIEKAQFKPTWVVFFAPSSSDFALPYLHKYFRFPQVAAFPESTERIRLDAKVGAIGPTTAEFLGSERSLRVDAVPAKPTAEQLVTSIRESDSHEVEDG